MKVKDLIARLSEFDPNVEVYYARGDYMQKVEWLVIGYTLTSSAEILHTLDYTHSKEYADKSGFGEKILVLS